MLPREWLQAGLTGGRFSSSTQSLSFCKASAPCECSCGWIASCFDFRETCNLKTQRNESRPSFIAFHAILFCVRSNRTEAPIGTQNISDFAAVHSARRIRSIAALHRVTHPHERLPAAGSLLSRPPLHAAAEPGSASRGTMFSRL